MSCTYLLLVVADPLQGNAPSAVQTFEPVVSPDEGAPVAGKRVLGGGGSHHRQTEDEEQHGLITEDRREDSKQAHRNDLTRNDSGF